MLGTIGNLTALLKRAQNLNGQIEELSRDLKNRRATGASGGGMVEIEVNGMQEVVRCHIDPAVFADHDAEFLGDLVQAAINQALIKAKQLHVEALKSMTGDLEMSGLKDALSRLGGNLPTSE